MKKYRCSYCGKQLEINSNFCSNECKRNYERKIKQATKKIPYFLLGIILGFITMFIGILLSHTNIEGIGITIMGLTVIILPFTTPETTMLFGYQKAKLLGRILGILLVFIGIWVGFAN